MTLTQGRPQRRRTSLSSTIAKLSVLCAVVDPNNFAQWKEHCSCKMALSKKKDSLWEIRWVFCSEGFSPRPLPSLPSQTDILSPYHEHVFSLTSQITGAIQRDLVTILVIFTFLEDRSKSMFLLQRWTYLLCLQKLNYSA